jgi:hypothetical protein
LPRLIISDPSNTRLQIRTLKNKTQKEKENLGCKEEEEKGAKNEM